MTPDEIIATAMLLGAEFVRSHRKSPAMWSVTGNGYTTGSYIHRHAAATAWLRNAHGFELDFNGELYKPRSKPRRHQPGHLAR